MEPESTQNASEKEMVGSGALVRPNAVGWWWRYRPVIGWQPGECLVKIWDDKIGPEIVWFAHGYSCPARLVNEGEWYLAVMPERPNAESCHLRGKETQPEK